MSADAPELSYAAAARRHDQDFNASLPPARRQGNPNQRRRLADPDAPPFTVHDRDNLWNKTDDVQQISLKQYNTANIRFASNSNITPRDLINALDDLDFSHPDVTAVRRPSPGHFSITFASPSIRSHFISHRGFTVNGYTPITPEPRQRTKFVQIRNASPELPDAAVIARLRVFGEVLSFRRCYHMGTEIENGFRTARMLIKTAIPSFIRLASESLHIIYEGQERTCRRCNRPGHEGRECNTHTCYNCDQIGHVASACALPTACSICKSIAHKAHKCPYALIDRIVSENPINSTLAVALQAVSAEPDSDAEESEDITEAADMESQQSSRSSAASDSEPPPANRSSGSTPDTTILSTAGDPSDLDPPPASPGSPAQADANAANQDPPPAGPAAPVIPAAPVAPVSPAEPVAAVDPASPALETPEDIPDNTSVASSKRKAPSESSEEFDPFSRKPTRPTRPPTGKRSKKKTTELN